MNRGLDEYGKLCNKVRMRYLVQFTNDWKGTWKFDAVSDVRAWEIVWDMIKEHTLVAIVNVDAIYELNDFDETIRKLPEYEDCTKTNEKQERKRIGKQDEKAIYRAYFSDSEYSGPYIANVSKNDAIALDIAKYKLKQHVEYNGLDISKIKVTKIEELNESIFFTLNLTRKKGKKNRIINVMEF